MKINLNQIVVVNGTPTTIETDIYEPLRSLMERALIQTSNTRIPLEDWEIKDAEGNVFSIDMHVGKARQSVNPAAVHADKLFLCLRAGVGA